MDLVRVLEILDDQKSCSTCHRQPKTNEQRDSLATLSEIHTERHRKTGQNQHTRVDSTHHRVEIVTSIREDFWKSTSQNCVCNKERAKEKNFGRKKEPHSKLRAIELLRRSLEMVREKWILLMFRRSMTMTVCMTCMICMTFMFSTCGTHECPRASAAIASASNSLSTT